jgi:hypothetical protein
MERRQCGNSAAITSRVRRGQQRRVCRWRSRNEGAAVAVGRGDEGSGYVVAERRDGCGARAVADREGAAGAAAVR